MAEADLKEAASIPGGQPASRRDIGQGGFRKDLAFNRGGERGQTPCSSGFWNDLPSELVLTWC